MILILRTEWNDAVTEKLVEGAALFLKEKGFSFKIEIVPGALELPLAAAWATKQIPDLEGIVACGCVIRGETIHFDIVAFESARKLMDICVKSKLPITQALLTVENLDQAYDRLGGKAGHKGKEAADALVKMLALKNRLQ